MYSRHSKLLIGLTIMILLVGCSANSATVPSSEIEVQPAENSDSPTKPPLPPTLTPQSESLTVEVEPAAKESPPPAGESWIKTIGGDQEETLQDLIMTADGGYLIVGSKNIQFDGDRVADLYLVETDANGEVLWEKTFSRDGWLYGAEILQTEGGNLLISGVESSAGTAGMDIFALQLDSERNEVWWKTFGGPLDEWGAVWPMEDGGYLMGGSIVDPDDIVADPGAAGYGGHAGRSNLYFARVDAEGNDLWSHSFGDELNVGACGAAPTPDGGFVLLGTVMVYPESGDDIILMRVDAEGETVWTRTWEEGSTSAFDLVATSDGGYLISGAIDRSDDPADPLADFLFIKVDADGNEIWLSTFGDPELTDYGQVVAEAADGGFVAAGESVANLYSANADIALIKIDEDGQFLWQETIEANTHMMFAKLLRHPDGGFVIAGSTVRNNQFDILLVKTDAQGRVAD